MPRLGPAGGYMRRREFITLIGGAATWPLVARAQGSQKMRRVGVLFGIAESDPLMKDRIKGFRLGMRDLGWIEGRDIQIEYRFAGANLDSIKRSVEELLRFAPDVIVANSTPVLAALQSATSTIPIVFVIVNDPVGQGFISSIANPGSNITGFSFIEFAIIGKWINLLADVKPNLSRVALMFNPDTAPYYDGYLRSFKASPQRTSVEVDAMHVRSVAEIDLAVAELGREPGNGLIAAPDPYILTVRGAILKAANKHRLPVISSYRQFVVEGSLMSYGPDTAEIFRRSSAYVDRILNGEPPGKLPAQSPDRFELVVNLKTAKALGLSVRESFLLLADEVIE
jgi:putative tryptophan/tyrosine transport system substrate-binding protein